MQSLEMKKKNRFYKYIGVVSC